MLDHVQGVVIELEPTRCVLRCGGLGLDLMVPLSTSENLERGQEACLYTILHIADPPRLLAFATREEREFCRHLLKVNTVGPATALAVLSHASPPRLRRLLAEGDEGALTAVKGVGRKTAQRIILDLGELARRGGSLEEVGPAAQAARDAATALVALGYREEEARKLVDRAHRDRPEAPAGELIRLAMSL